LGHQERGFAVAHDGDDRVGDSQASEVVGRDHLVRAGPSQAPDARLGFAARAFHSSLLEDRFVERRAQT
jgi:hypothetical protein